jgi:hypothetical protein
MSSANAVSYKSKAAILLGAAVLAISGIAVYRHFLRSDLSATPKQYLYCASPVYDFGPVPDRDAVLEHTFSIFNNSSKPIEIDNLKSSCSCTSAELSRKSIPPGEQIQVRAKVDWRGNFGEQQASIAVSVNTPVSEVLLLRMRAEVGTHGVISPRVLNLEAIPFQSEKEGQVQIATSARSGPVEVMGIDADPAITVLRPVLGGSASRYESSNRQGGTFLVRVKAGADRDSYRGTVVFRLATPTERFEEKLAVLWEVRN